MVRLQSPISQLSKGLSIGPVISQDFSWFQDFLQIALYNFLERREVATKERMKLPVLCLNLWFLVCVDV